MSRPVSAAAAPRPVRVGIWGLFDVEDFAAAVVPRVVRHELRRRLPSVEVRAFSPLGYDHATRWDGGEPSEPLGAWSAERLSELVEELDAVVLAGDLAVEDGAVAAAYGLPVEELAHRAPSRFLLEGLGPELEAECPVALFGVGVPDLGAAAPRVVEALASRPAVSVTDEVSRRRLAAAGLGRPVEVVPHPAVLLRRTFAAEVLDKRIEYLRVMDWYPRGEAVVLHGDDRHADDVPSIVDGLRPLLADRPELIVVCIELAPGDRAFADAVAGALEGRARRPGAVTMEDVGAVLRSATAVVTPSLPLAMAAVGFDRPTAVLDLAADPRAEAAVALAEVPEALVRAPRDLGPVLEKLVAAGSRADVAARLQGLADAELDRVAAIAAESAALRASTGRVPTGESDVEGLRRRLGMLADAHRARGRLLVTQRWRFADRVRDAEARERRTRAALEEDIAGLEAERARLEAEVAGKQGELDTLLNTRTFRYTAGLRRIWARVRQAFGR